MLYHINFLFVSNTLHNTRVLSLLYICKLEYYSLNKILLLYSFYSKVNESFEPTQVSQATQVDCISVIDHSIHTTPTK